MFDAVHCANRRAPLQIGDIAFVASFLVIIGGGTPTMLGAIALRLAGAL